jgi:hypothetical protein
LAGCIDSGIKQYCFVFHFAKDFEDKMKKRTSFYSLWTYPKKKKYRAGVKKFVMGSQLGQMQKLFPKARYYRKLFHIKNI